MQHWISVKDQLPTTGQKVDIWLKTAKTGKRFTDMVWMSSIQKFRSTVTSMNYDLDSVTHWMPVPTAPE